MDLGVVIGDRFALEGRAGAGGMATVYRALDRLTGATVALKVLERRDALNEERFEREARLLAELSHPGLVRYVAHGAAGEARYLVMEWLDGCDLAERLARGPIGVSAAVALCRRVAEALVVAHAQGIMHRDLKPSNLFLVDGRTDRVKVVDFGLARQMGTESATRTGVSIGTPRFMAPEQVRGRRDLDARVDVYGLGAVLYSCLAGRPAFVGSDEMAILAKVLLEDPPPLRELAPEVPAPLAALVASMLAKERLDRPDDAAAVVARIDAIAGDPILDATPAAPEMIAVTGGEQRLLSIVLVGAASGVPAAEDDGSEGTTATRTEQGDAPAALRELLARHGDRFGRLPDGSLVMTVAGSGTATDQAAQAARLALSIRAHVPGVAIALATGRGQLARKSPSGDVIDRAAAGLRRAIGGGRRAIVVDDVTAELLGDRFTTRAGDAGVELLRERDADPTRTLLGRATPCVGREPELAMLEAVWDQCAGDAHARAVLVTGEAGVGKSRLRYELVRRIAERGLALQIWIGRGDPMRVGASFGMLAPAIRRAAGVLEGEPAEQRRAKLRARLGRHLAGDDAARVTEFLGELVGVPFPDEGSARLRTARHDPRLMSEQMRRAWDDWVGAESAAGPLLIVLEDLHWGDWPTVKFIDSMLVALSDRPIMVLALARPDVKTLLPGLWAGRPVGEIALGALPRRASERLVREVLGDRVGAATVARLVEQSAGNALFLEELIRAAADGKGDAPPASVLAMVQARLDRLPADARRVLRAASVFSSVFWASAVGALVGADLPVGDWIEFLLEEEVIARRGERKFPGEEELVFRHALVRDAAYSLLTDTDRKLGHRQAALWLERAGETDALVLADHNERGGERARAADQYLRAAEQALEASDLAATLARAASGLACLDADGAPAMHPTRGGLHLVVARVHAWNGHTQAQLDAARRALACLARGEPAWCRAIHQLGHACAYLGRQDELVAIGDALCALGDGGVAHRAFVLASTGIVAQLILVGEMVIAERLLALVEPRLGAPVDDDPQVVAEIQRIAAMRAGARGDLAECFEHDAASIETFERAGDLPNAYRQRANTGAELIGLGAYERARATLIETAEAAAKLGLSGVAAVCHSNLGLTIGLLGDHAGARVVLVAAIAELGALGMRRLEALARADLSVSLRRCDELAAAAAEVDRAVALVADIPPARAYCLARRAQIALAQGRAADALADAGAANEILAALGGIDRTDGEPLVRLTWAEALEASGDRPAAARAIAQARARLVEVAARIGDAAWRTSYTDHIADNARTVELDRAWNPAG